MVSPGVLSWLEICYQRTTNHGGDQFIHICFCARLGHNQASVPQHRYFITDFKIFHPFYVKCKSERNSLSLQLTHHLKEFSTSGAVRDEVGSSVNNFGMIGNRFLRSHTSASEIQTFFFIGWVQSTVIPSFLNRSEGFFFILPSSTTPREFFGYLPRHVIYNTSFKTLVQLWCTIATPVFQCILWSGKVHFFSIQYDGSFIFLIGSKETFHHCRFPAPFSPISPHNGSRFDIHANMLQNLISTE